MSISQIWDLDSIFEGGSHSPSLQQFITDWTADLSAFEEKGIPAPLTGETRESWVEAIQTLYQLGERIRQAGAFVNCLVAADVKDEKAHEIRAGLDALYTRLGNIWTQLSSASAEQEDEAWDQLLAHPDLSPVSFHLNEERDFARQRMEPKMEMLANDLARDGYHAWNRLYMFITGEKQVEYEGKTLSLGQLQNQYEDSPDREVRQKSFELYESSFAELAKTCTMALNYQGGFRLSLYKHRGWDSFLQEPLERNRITPETLETMMGVIDDKARKLLDYFAAKARLIGVDQLSWYDVASPVGESSQEFNYTEAADFVVDNIRVFNQDIADFCRMAIDQRWVEAENRPGKRAGAFCSPFSLNKQSRVFMTFNGSYSGMLTLAHELGHGYHNWVMRDLPLGARVITSCVAETASTFNESVVNTAGLNATKNIEERRTILGTKLNDAAVFLMNLRARFLFDKSFYERRGKGQLNVDELNELMTTAQKKAFKNGLADYHPLFWASKLHFYITGNPFYNFPYTFGYLFSNGVFARAQAEGSDFQERYIALLRDTGSMSAEKLAQTHLGVDLTKPDFWETAVDQVLAPVDEFVTLVN